MTCERISDLLDPYLDGETDALTARAVEEHLANCPACNRRLAARRALQTALRDKLPNFRAPQNLRDIISTQSTQAPDENPAPPRPQFTSATVTTVATAASSAALSKPRARFSFATLSRYATAAALILAGGIAIGLIIRPAPPDPLNAIAAAVETDHIRSLQEQHLLDVVSTDQHTVKPWFAGRIPFAPPVPDPPGFPLRGGRLDWVQGQQAAALVYARNKHTINLLIWPANGAPLPSIPTARTSATGHNLLLWSAGDLNFCAVSDVEASQLAEFVAAYRAAK